jgi:hypothetical protein
MRVDEARDALPLLASSPRLGRFLLLDGREDDGSAAVKSYRQAIQWAGLRQIVGAVAYTPVDEGQPPAE